MPIITDEILSKARSKKFEKKSYRPWDSLSSQDTSVSELLIDNLETINEEIEVRNIPDNVDFDMRRVDRGLCGLQRSCLINLLSKIDHKIDFDDNFVFTELFSVSQISNELNVPVNSVKSALNRLKKIGLVKKYEHKTGRGGFSVLKISKSAVNYFDKIGK